MRVRMALLAVSVLCAAASAYAAENFAASFTWEGTGKCMEPNSPPFQLSHVPAGTKILRFNMVDLDFTAFHHGGGTSPMTARTRSRAAFSTIFAARARRARTITNGRSRPSIPAAKCWRAAKTMKPFPPE